MKKLDTILIPFIVDLILETNEQKLKTYVGSFLSRLNIDCKHEKLGVYYYY